MSIELITTKQTFHIPINSRVFVLDDRHERLQWFRRKLQGNGIRLICATNSQDGLSVLKNDPKFDFVFLDHDLGKIGTAITDTSLEVARFLATLPEEKRPHIVIHSANWWGARRLYFELPYSHVCEFGKFDIKVTI